MSWVHPREAKQLLRAHRSSLRRGRSSEKGASGAPDGRVATVKTDVPDAKRPELPAIVDGVLPVQLSDGIDDDEGMACATPELGNVPDGDGPVRIVLESKVAEAATVGMPTAAVEQLRDLLMEFRDVFRLKFGRDPPVKVEPLKVRLEEGAMPVKSGLWRYPPPHMAFLEKHVRELDKA
ncbi:hypothetical protein DYB31_006090, partial [Aphanomyces astaci]